MSAADPGSTDGTDDTYVAGESQDLREVLNAFEERTEGVLLLASEVESLTAEVRALRADVITRPSRREVDLKRRRTVVALVLALLTVMFLHDEHIEHCSPGARVVAGIDYLLSSPPSGKQTPEQRQAEFTRRYDNAPAYCDATFPTHTHDGSDWPSSRNLIGFGLYGFGLLSLGYWAARPGRKQYDTPPNTKGSTA